ncbi:hypothetical protein GCM10009422_00280 [Brevundimonas kwangchunensis]|uniref:Glycosyltransferase n=2 Tax=Brevundimonas kwangchunensis TaxID=322163 RepID=A0ABN1GDY0_9CAUL
MKVAIVLPPGCQFSAARPNSMETVVRTLAAAACDEQTLRIFCDAGAEERDPRAWPLPSGLGRSRALVRALQAFEPDIIEFHQNSRFAARLAQRFPDAVRILYRHNDVRPPRGAFAAWRYRQRYEPFDGLVFVSQASQNAFVDAFPEFADRAFTIRNPIDVGLWGASPENREKLIVFSGRAIPEKGVDLLCRSLPEVLERHPEWRAKMFLGDWSKHAKWAAPHVEQMLARSDRITVHRHAPLAEVREATRRAAIAVTPSVWAEPLGLSALEAHAAGAALVSSGRGGLKEVSGPHALYVDPLDETTLGQAIERLILDPDERLRLARGGQTYVADVHAPAVRAVELKDLRRSLILAKAVRSS